MAALFFGKLVQVVIQAELLEAVYCKRLPPVGRSFSTKSPST